MNKITRSILKRLGWKPPQPVPEPLPEFGLRAFFPLLKSLGFTPRHIVDIGANHGNWTRTAVNYFPNADYTLVEPQDALKTNIEDLLAQGKKLHWINAGVADREGNMVFTISHRDDSSNFRQLDQKSLPSGCRQVDVRVRTLNEIVASSGLPVPELVKIDAEGFDLKVLTGATDLFGKTDIILIEAMIHNGGWENTLQEVLRRMAEAGYRILDITDLNRSPKHGVLWLCELAFISNQSPLLKAVTTYE